MATRPPRPRPPPAHDRFGRACRSCFRQTKSGHVAPAAERESSTFASTLRRAPIAPYSRHAPPSERLPLRPLLARPPPRPRGPLARRLHHHGPAHAPPPPQRRCPNATSPARGAAAARLPRPPPARSSARWCVGWTVAPPLEP